MKMRNLYRFLSLLLLTTGFIPVCQAEEITIGTKTALTTNNAPVNYNYKYSRCQMIFLQDELNLPSGSKISAITFQYKSKIKDIQGNLTVEVGETTRNDFTVATYLQDLTRCYSGPHNMQFAKADLDTTVTYHFESPYVYQGGNIVIYVHNTDTQRSSYVTTPFYCTNTPGKSVLVNYNDNNITGGTISSQVARPNITFTYEPGEIPLDPVLSTGSETLDFGLVKQGTTYSGVIHVKNKGRADLTMTTVEGIETPFNVTLPDAPVPYGESISVPFRFTPQSTGIFTQQVTIVSNGGNAVLTLRGEAYGESACFEHFDILSIKPLPSGWRCANNTYGNVTSLANGGVNDSRYLTCSEPADTIFSPVISGEGFFYAKRKSSSSKLSVYLVSSDGSISALPNTSINDSWQKIPFNITTSDTRLAFCMTNVCLDEFFAPVCFIPEKDVELFSNAADRPSSYMSLNEADTTKVIFRIRNMGRAPIAAGSYQIRAVFNKEIPFTIIFGGQQSTDGVITHTPALAMDESLILEAGMVISLSEKEKIQGLTFALEIIGDDDSANNSVTTGSNISIVPKIGKLTFNPGYRKDNPLNFGIFKVQKTLTATLQNEGIDELLISGYSLSSSSKFIIEGEAPISIPAKGKATLQLKLAGEPGEYEDSLTILHNGSSDSFKKLYLSGRIISKIALLEGFEDTEFPPIFWSQTGSAWFRYTASASYIYEGTACLAKNNSTADTLITPKLRIKEGDIFSLYARCSSGSEDLKLFLSKDKKQWSQLATYKVYNSYSIKETSFPEEVIGEYYVAITGNNLYIDLIQGPDIVYENNRIELEAFEGKSNGMVNISQPFAVTLRNTGLKDQGESDYTLTLMDGDKQLGVYKTRALGFGQRESLSVDWTPRQPGEYLLYARLSFDEKNVYTDTIRVTVKEEMSLQHITVGNYDSPTNNTPWATNYKHNAAEIFYLAEELNLTAGNKIMRISLPYVAEDTISYNAQVWLKNTVESEYASAVKLTDTDKTKVFEKLYRFEKSTVAAPGLFEMDLEIPFEYTGENLSVLISFDAGRYKAIRFFKNDQPTNRTISCKTDNNGKAPDYFATLSSALIKSFPTLIFTAAKEPATISGIIRSEGVALADAVIGLTSGEIQYHTTSTAEGTFVVPVCQLNRKYELSVSKEGYLNFTDSVTIEEDAIILPDISLKAEVENPPFTLTLDVTAITGVSLASTPVYLENNELGLIYDASIDADGNCTIRDIYPGTHTLRIEKQGLAKYENTNLQISKSLQLEILLLENVHTPYALNGDVYYNPRSGESELNLKWNRETDYFFEDFESHEPFAIEFSPWTGIDADNANAAQLQGAYQNRGLKQYATIFNPLVIVPSVWYTYPVLRPYSGKQYAAFIRTESSVQNNDWLISPKIKVGVNNILRFKAKAGDATKERFRVAISVTGTEQSDFKVISSGNYEEVDYKEWKDMVYDLAAYEGKEIHVAIQYISQAAFMLMVDDIYVGPQAQNNVTTKRVIRNEQGNPERFVIYCDGEAVDTTSTNGYQLHNLTAGEHMIGVKAIYQVSESEIASIPVTVDGADKFASLAIQVAVNGGSSESIPVEFVHQESGEQHTEPISAGVAQLPYLRKGTYLINIRDQRYTEHSATILLEEDKTHPVSLEEILYPVSNLVADYEMNEGNRTMDINMSWNQDAGWEDNFETYSDFAQQFGDWTCIDRDQLPGYGINFNGAQVSFPGVATPMACMIFNAASTNPSMYEDGAIRAVEGDKSVIFFSPQGAQADDWLIAPKQKIREDYILRFYVKSYSAMYPDKVRIAVSESTDPDSFTVLDEITTTDTWVQYEISLDAYKGQEIHIAFNHVSTDKFMMLLDLVYVGPASDSPVISTGAHQYKVYCDGNEVATTSSNTHLLEAIPVKSSITVGVKAVYESGESQITEYEVIPLTVGLSETNQGRFYAVAAERKIRLTAPQGTHVLIFNQLGQQVTGMITDSDTSSFPMDTTGVYFVKVSFEGIMQTFRVVIR